MYPTWTSEELCHAGIKSARPFIAPSFEPQWGLTQLEPLRPTISAGTETERWEEAVSSIDFSHSSRKAWRTINITAGIGAPLACALSRQSPSPRSSWRTGHRGRGPRGNQARQQAAVRPMEDSNTWGSQYLWTFRPEELAAALRRLKTGKSPELDSIFSEFILKARSALKSRFCDFLTSCMHQLKIPKDLEKSTSSCYP